jgi:hypothetical protein
MTVPFDSFRLTLTEFLSVVLFYFVQFRGTVIQCLTDLVDGWTINHATTTNVHKIVLHLQQLDK